MPTSSTVLLVDDDPAACFLLQRQLRPYADRVRVLTAENGQQAVQLLHQQPENAGPVLVLLDLQMPQLDGFGFLATRHTWSPARQADTHVVVLSITDLVATRRAVTALGVPFQSKPLPPGKLAHLLWEHLGCH